MQYLMDMPLSAFLALMAIKFGVSVLVILYITKSR